MNDYDKRYKENKKMIEEYKVRFLTQTNFPPFKKQSQDPDNKLAPFKHTAHLIFIRTKFLFLGLLNEMETKNAFAAFAILKTYWETVAMMGYFILSAQSLLQLGRVDDLNDLSRKLAMGGKKFPTKKMLEDKGLPLEDYILPNVLTMIDKIDKDWNKRFKEGGLKPISMFREEYDEFIAEAGHPTYMGLYTGGRWLADGSLLPDLNKSWSSEDESGIDNYCSLASTIFFDYWNKFLNLTK